jgi:hypothetical protein
MTTGAVMTRVPLILPYVGLTPIINTLLFPIPSALLPTKDSIGYLLNAFNSVYGNDFSTGAAIMNYGEYFLMGGWPVVIIMFLIIGWLMRRLWYWFLWRRSEPIAQVCYTSGVTFLYVVISRGYMPQVAYTFAFVVLPLFIFYHYASKRVTLYNVSDSSRSS